MNNQILALIVARGGSKGIPRKNLQRVGGKPLIAHTVLAAARSRRLDRVVLSTDDPEIADVAKSYGAQTPFTRPSDLAGDDSPVIDTALHALSWLDQHESYRPGYIMLLQPTSPLRTEHDIDGAIQLAFARGANAVVSVCEARRHPCLAKCIAHDGTLRPFVESIHQTCRRQDLPPVYDLNGAVYLVRSNVLLDEQTWCPRNAQAFLMPVERSLDVDSPWDLRVADLIMSTGEIGS